jgi:ubiquinone/menaquinone biosynthesis C-methylase UbiE
MSGAQDAGSSPERGTLSPASHDQLAAVFGHPGVAEAYRHRSPYPDEVFGILTGLITDQPRVVLDLGAGEGALARPLARLVDQVDAVDISAAMIEAGRRQPDGDRPNLRWIVGAAQTAPLGGPYALVTAGASLHWMPRQQTLGRLARVMTGNAVLAMVGHGPQDLPWLAELTEIITRHSRSPGFNPSFSLVDALAADGLLRITGRASTGAVPFCQSVQSFVEQFHSTASLAREWMSAAESAAFDRAVEEVAAPHATDGMLELPVVAHLAWGRPA